MSRWQTQIRTNLEDTAYSDLLDRGIASTPGTLAAGLVNVRYGEGCLRWPGAEPAPDSELAQVIRLSQWLFPPDPAPAWSSTRAAALTRVGEVESAFWTTRRERLFAQVLGERVLVLAVGSAKNHGAILALVKEVVATASQSDLPAFEQMRDVLAAGLLDPRRLSFTHTHRRAESERSEFSFEADMAGVLAQFFDASVPPRPAVFHQRSGERLAILNTQLATATHSNNWSSLTFDPEHLVFVLADRRVAHQGLVLNLLNRATDDTVRVWADGLLQFGIDPIIEPSPKTPDEALAIVEELRALHENDLIGRLRISGCSNHGIGEGARVQRCKECINYHPKRRWCDLPELPIPVDAHWRCRLWKS
jgi:hypothetical protein